MSGEKAHRARVVSPDELRRRSVESARARCATLQARLAKLAEVVEGTVNSNADLSTQSLDSLRNLENQLHGAIRDATAALELQRARSQLKVIVEKVDLVELGPVSLGVIVHAEPSEVLKKTGTVLERLSEVEDSSFVDETLTEIHGVELLPEPQQTLALLALHHSVTQAVKGQRTAKRCQADAYAEAIKVAHLDGKGAEAIRDRTADIKDQAALTRFRSEVRGVLEEAEREANAAFVTQQAMVVMAELGYVVDEPFEFIEHHGDGFLARRDDLPKHALQVSVDATAGVLQTRVVAVGQTTIEEDVSAEEDTCDDALVLIQRLSGRGIESATLFHRAAGELPVAKTPTTAPRKKKRTQLKEMGLNG